MRINADVIIYLFITICLSLLVYNVAYIFRRKSSNKGNYKKSLIWQKEIINRFGKTNENDKHDKRHKKRLLKKLTGTNSLIAYLQALERIKVESPDELREYLYHNYVVFQELAYKYRHRESMERAFYADFIRRFPPYSGLEHRQIIDTLIMYMENSTIYCHENVLCALYALGNIDSVVKALGIINEKGWFHHQKLIADGLATFSGDKEALASVLWDKYKVWSNKLMLAVVQFITICSPNYCEEFFPVMQDKKADIEIRLAVIRYYRRHVYKPAKHILIDYVRTDGQVNENLAIVAATALEKYPGDETVEALKSALSSPNWHIRYNAATSLSTMRDLGEELITVLFGNDKYAKEILRYKVEEDIKSEQTESEKKEAATI